MDIKPEISLNHKINVIARNQLFITGVRDVLQFDAKEVLLDTEMGILMIRGNELHVKRLTLEKGEVDIDGMINNLTYSDNKFQNKSGGSIITKVFG